jgi:beta-glucanase (GH16 family)
MIAKLLEAKWQNGLFYRIVLFCAKEKVMKKLVLKFTSAVIALSLTFGFFSNSQAAPVSSIPAGYTRLIFSDDFNTLNPVWHHGHWWEKDTDITTTNTNEQQAYVPGNVSIENGNLKITALKQTVNVVNEWPDRPSTYYYTSGLVETGGDQYGYANKFTFQYGYMEARIKIPSGQGLWPAFWMWPANYQDPPEIDTMEIIGNLPNELNMTYHYVGGQSGQVYNGPDFSQDYHIYGCEWTPTYIAWYIDGAQVARFTDAAKIPQQRMYLILNLAVGGDWPGPVSNSALPASMLVDWLHVYQKPLVIDSSSKAITYSSGWQNISTTSAYAGSYKTTNIQGSSLKVSFTGKSFSVLYTSGPAFGKIRAYVDGVLVATINEQTSSKKYQQRWNYSGTLAGGSHTLKLVYIGPSTSQASLDAIIIQ